MSGDIITGLWRKFCRGDYSAFSELYRLLFPGLLAYGCKIGGDYEMAEDVIQELFLKLYQNKVKLKDDEKLRVFLFRSVKNGIYTQLERSARQQQLPNVPEDFKQDFMVDEDYLGSQEEDIRQKVRSIIKGLTPRQREVVYLRFIHEMSYEEISGIMGINLQSAKNLLSRTVVSIRKSSLAEMESIFLLIAINMKNFSD